MQQIHDKRNVLTCHFDTVLSSALEVLVARKTISLS